MYKINYIQNGGVKKILIHVTGFTGSGKTTLGSELNKKYENKIYVKDFDDLYGEFTNQTEIIDYQIYMNKFIDEHNDKPLILVGLDADLCLGPIENPKMNGYNIDTKYKFYIDIDIETNLQQWFYRQIEKLYNRKKWFYENWLKDNKSIQNKLFRFVDLNERKETSFHCDELYKSKGYKFMSYNEIMKEIMNILKID